MVHVPWDLGPRRRGMIDISNMDISAIKALSLSPIWGSYVHRSYLVLRLRCSLYNVDQPWKVRNLI